MTTYIQLLNKIEAFCNAHYQIQRYGGEFREQMPNLSTESEKYPIVFVTPTAGVPMYDTNQISLDIYCVDIIQKGRENINTIVSDCHLILTDLYGYFSQGSDLSVDVIGQPSQRPLNNLDLDYVAGWVMTIVFEVDGYCVDAIPMGDITPGGSECADAEVENSTATYSTTVASGGSLVLPDSQINVNGVDEGDVVSVKTIDVNITDGVNPVTPDSVSLVGNTLTVAVPSGSSPAGATLMKTGQTTSYRTGDDGDIEAGRATDFLTLNYTNPFGNTNRFTDELGGSTYTNNIVIDWSTYDNVAGTVLGIVKNFVTLGTAIWDDAIDNSLAYSVGTFTTGWRLINRTEINNLCNMGNSTFPLNYAPFNAGFGGATWTSNTLLASTSFAWYLNNTTADIRYQAKTTVSYYIPVRTFTVSGTTLS